MKQVKNKIKPFSVELTEMWATRLHNNYKESTASYTSDSVLHISISAGNSKCNVPSFSLPPVITCNASAPCAKVRKGRIIPECYACKECTGRKPAVEGAWYRNLYLWRNRPQQVEAELMQFLHNGIYIPRFFRWFVSGDIPDKAFLTMMVRVAKATPNCKFLCFTKRFSWANEYLSGNVLPSNMQIVFSLWGDSYTVENAHNLPMTQVCSNVEEYNLYSIHCPGKCSECCCNGLGCWNLAKGETIAFMKH